MEKNPSNSSSKRGWLIPTILIWVIALIAIVAAKSDGLLVVFLLILIYIMLYLRRKHKDVIKQIYEEKSADFKRAFKQALSEDKKYQAIKFNLIILFITFPIIFPNINKDIKEHREKESSAGKNGIEQKAEKETEQIKLGYGTAVIVNLLRVGPVSADIEYKGQKVTVRKYYPTEGSLMGGSTDLRLLVACIGYQVIAVVDNNGEILGLYCPEKNKSLAQSLKEGNIEGAVLVVPDEYINFR